MKQDYKYQPIAWDFAYRKPSKLKRFIKFIWHQILPVVGYALVLTLTTVFLCDFYGITKLSNWFFSFICIGNTIFIFLMAKWVNHE